MEQIWSPTVAFALLVVVTQSAPSILEGSIGEFYFTIPNVTRNFNDASSWCNTNRSALAVVNDSNIQSALFQFLNSAQLSSRIILYINVKLYQKTGNTWFLLNGSRYDGSIGSQDPYLMAGLNYSLYCRLTYDSNRFAVHASAPSVYRNYICDYEESLCFNGSANGIVYSRRCYIKYDNEQYTWYQARERCMKNGGDLAQFQTVTDSPPFNTSWLNKSLSYWVGIRWNDLSWKSSELGEEYIFTSWSNGTEPNNYTYTCGCVDQNGSPPWSWADCPCNTQRNFVCLKKVAVLTTTLMTTTAITTTMNPTTTAGLVTITGRFVTTDNNSITATVAQKNLPMIIGLAVGIGGGGLILLIVVIVIVVIIIKRRHRRSNGGSDSMSDSNGGGIDNIQNGVYAAVVPGSNKGKQTESSSEIIYTSPVFKEPNSTAPDSNNYETATLVEEPYAISSVRGHTKSIFPQGYSDVYANAKE